MASALLSRPVSRTCQLRSLPSRTPSFTSVSTSPSYTRSLSLTSTLAPPSTYRAASCHSHRSIPPRVGQLPFHRSLNSTRAVATSEPAVVHASALAQQTGTLSPGAGHGHGAAPSSETPNLPRPTDKPPVRPYKSRSVMDLLNSLLVFQMCSMPFLVQSSPYIIEWAEKLKLHGPVYFGIKHTFFRHFCGGENLAEVVPTMDSFKAANVGSILDLALEADVDAASLTGTAAQEQCQKVAAMFRESIDIASKTPGSLIALKVTALVPPLILQRWSNTLQLLLNSVKTVDTNSDGKLTLKEFESLSSVFPALHGKSAANCFKRADRDGDGLVDATDLLDVFSLYNSECAKLLATDNTNPTNPDVDLLTKEDLVTTDLLLPDINSVAKHAQDLRVRILVDAEQTYFQPAVDDVGLNLCKLYNPPLHGVNETGRKGPIIYNTYQLYLKDGYARMVSDVERAERFGYAFGIKIVRGAYMHSERERAQELGISDPINPDISATHATYNKAIDHLLEKIAASPRSTTDAAPPSDEIRPLSFIIASHNHESVARACRQMKSLGLAPEEGSVAFAQLMGMQDGTTHGLATSGYKVFKYIPYGPIEVTIPYLQRRALENADILNGKSGLAQDIQAITQELRARFKLSTA